MQDALQNRKHAFLLEAKAITTDEGASPVTLKLQSMHGAWPSKICCGSASSPLQCPAAAAKSFQSCPTPCDPIDSSPSGSTIPGILQARTLEWVAISFSKKILMTHIITMV